MSLPKKKPTTVKSLKIHCKGFGFMHSMSPESIQKLKTGEIKVWTDEAYSQEWDGLPEFIAMVEQLQQAEKYFEQFIK
jgi:hypothetical protein